MHVTLYFKGYARFDTRFHQRTPISKSNAHLSHKLMHTFLTIQRTPISQINAHLSHDPTHTYLTITLGS